MTTLKDVAKHLGVSVSTVSRVINNTSYVSSETREMVEDAIKKLNYYPNETARRLKNNTSNVLGVIIPDITNPFFANIIRGVDKETQEKSFTFLLCDTAGDVKREKEAMNLLLRQNVAGIVSASIATGVVAQKIYSPPGRHVVFIDNMPDLKTEFSSVTIDNYQAAKELTEILINKGHRDICMISGPSNESSSRERLSGFMDMLREQNIRLNEDCIRYGDYDIESGKQIMERFLKDRRVPTAVFVANNFMAYGAVHAIYEAGLRVPEDIEIGTFDIIDYTGLLKNKFLSVTQPAFDIGRIAAAICIDNVRNNSIRNSSRVVLKHQIED